MRIKLRKSCKRATSHLSLEDDLLLKLLIGVVDAELFERVLVMVRRWFLELVY